MKKEKMTVSFPFYYTLFILLAEPAGLAPHLKVYFNFIYPPLPFPYTNLSPPFLMHTKIKPPLMSLTRTPKNYTPHLTPTFVLILLVTCV